MGSLGAPEIILIIIAILILFGGRKIPELMKGLGKGMKEFKDATRPDAPPTPNYQAPQPGYGPPAGYAQAPPAVPGGNTTRPSRSTSANSPL